MSDERGSLLYVYDTAWRSNIIILETWWGGDCSPWTVCESRSWLDVEIRPKRYLVGGSEKPYYVLASHFFVGGLYSINLPCCVLPHNLCQPLALSGRCVCPSDVPRCCAALCCVVLCYTAMQPRSSILPVCLSDRLCV